MDSTNQLARPRDADATREAILVAARTVFARRGFDGAGLREIAAAADCNVALIARYFGNKHGLFRAAMRDCIDFDSLLAVPHGDFPAALAAFMVAKRKSPDEFDAMFAAIRSATSQEALAIVREEVGDPMARALRDYLGGEKADERAALILSLMAGFDVARHVIGNDALGYENDKSLQERLAAAIEALMQPI